MGKVNLRPYFDLLTGYSVPNPHVINLEVNEPLDGEDCGLSDSHRSAILLIRELCSYGGVVRAGLVTCYEDHDQPLFRVNLIAVSKDKKQFSCSVIMKKSDLYIVAYTFGKYENGDAVWYQFKKSDSDFQFNVKVLVDISHGGSKITPPSDLISAKGLFNTICSLHNGRDVGAVARHIKTIIWIVPEPARFNRILDRLSVLFSDYESEGLSRSFEDWILVKSWDYFCNKMIDCALKSTVWINGSTENKASVLSMEEAKVTLAISVMESEERLEKRHEKCNVVKISIEKLGKRKRVINEESFWESPPCCCKSDPCHCIFDLDTWRTLKKLAVVVKDNNETVANHLLRRSDVVGLVQTKDMLTFKGLKGDTYKIPSYLFLK